MLWQSCDLLSKNCIFVLTNNVVGDATINGSVVICFQKIVSLFWRTTYICALHSVFRCDLLSKNCIFVLTNNCHWSFSIEWLVVICFQKIVSLFWRTTTAWKTLAGGLLWFAFKKLYLCSDEQPTFRPNKRVCSCDLLSKNCIFVLTNNLVIIVQRNGLVVICFQKIVSLFWRTTLQRTLVQVLQLWFAFKKLYLCSDEQQAFRQVRQEIGCDLLSKNCIFVLTNNTMIVQ